MHGCFRLHNSIQRYPWGSSSFIPEWLDRPNPGSEPWAELWIGAHPRGPSQIELGAEAVALDAWIAAAPERALGRAVAERYGGQLPYLLKILSAAEPLSLQVHPDEAGARAGFAREEAEGVPLDSRERTYADPRAKPELIFALTPFEALCGFRPSEERARLVEVLGDPWEFLAGPDPVAALACLLRQPPCPREEIRQQLTDLLGPLRDEPAFACVLRLAEKYPNDPGCLAPLLLNLVTLEPGQALFLEPGVLHAYLGGSGLEVMASSDNVLRAGLTSKWIDIDQLVEVLNPNACQYMEIKPELVTPGRYRFNVPSDCFALERLVLDGRPTPLLNSQGPELLLAASSGLRVADERSLLPLSRGDSLFLCPERPSLRLEGSGEAFRVTLGRLPG